MTFEDLPARWDTLPLTDPHLAADVVDLFLKDSDRRNNALLVLLCDDDLRPVQSLIIDGVNWRCSALERRQTYGFLEHLPVGGVVVAISSPHPIPPDVAERWRRTTEDACREIGPLLLHFCSAEPNRMPVHVGQPNPGSIAS